MCKQLSQVADYKGQWGSRRTSWLVDALDVSVSFHGKARSTHGGGSRSFATRLSRCHPSMLSRKGKMPVLDSILNRTDGRGRCPCSACAQQLSAHCYTQESSVAISHTAVQQCHLGVSLDTAVRHEEQE